MKTLFHFITSIILVMSMSLNAQNGLSSAEWQEDLRYLQNIIHKEYPILFKKTTAKDFDAAVEQLYNEIPSLEAHEIPVAFARIVSSFLYGHTQITFSTLAKNGVLPVNLYHFSDGVYIEGVQKAHEKTLGAKVLKVGGMPVEKALTLIRPVVPAENDYYFKGYGLRFLTVPDVLHTQRVIPELSDTITLTLEKDGNVFEYTFPKIDLKELSRGYLYTIPNDTWISSRALDKTPLYLKYLNDKYFFFEYLKDSKTLYVRQSTVVNHESETLKDFYNRLFDFIDSNDVEKLIYDVRLNGGGNNYNNVHLIKGLMARPSINKKGHFFYIIGRNTFSACQNLTNEITNYTEAILVGEPTAENVNFLGDNRPERLPNSNITAYLSYAWWQDKPQWENRDATLPHIAVDMSFDDYINNEDPIVHAAMNFKNDGDFILDPMAHLTQLFTERKYDQVKSDGAKIAKNPQYRYYDFENEFSKAGNRLVQSGNLQAGHFVLELVADLYPESVSAIYSLANVQEQLKLTDKAIVSYKKIIDLDPKGSLAIVAKSRIEALKKQ
ncbi:tol-pal system YbgF family protein [uncultured Psychroserpens sp.]|uniref:tetratricopeptide repeat protein n=1 Tax=uncultured Psychroserpens sp. TaxID=255436 RepID=UPI002624BCEE|nr:S41 family peptidase [uncultured Psychroserpens sp.]